MGIPGNIHTGLWSKCMNFLSCNHFWSACMQCSQTALVKQAPVCLPLYLFLFTVKLSYLIEATFGNINVAVAHLHVDPQALHDWQTVLVVPQVLWSNSLDVLNHVCKVFHLKPFYMFAYKECHKDQQCECVCLCVGVVSVGYLPCVKRLFSRRSNVPWNFAMWKQTEPKGKWKEVATNPLIWTKAKTNVWKLLWIQKTDFAVNVEFKNTVYNLT